MGWRLSKLANKNWPSHRFKIYYRYIFYRGSSSYNVFPHRNHFLIVSFTNYFIDFIIAAVLHRHCQSRLSKK